MSIEYVKTTFRRNSQAFSKISAQRRSEDRQRAIEERLKEYEVSFLLQKQQNGTDNGTDIAGNPSYKFTIGEIKLTLLPKAPTRLKQRSLPVGKKGIVKESAPEIMKYARKDIKLINGWKDEHYNQILSLTTAASPNQRVKINLYTLYELLYGVRRRHEETKTGKHINVGAFAKAVFYAFKKEENPSQALKDALFWLDTAATPAINMVKADKKISGAPENIAKNFQLTLLIPQKERLEKALADKLQEQELLAKKNPLIHSLTQDNITETSAFFKKTLSQQTFLVNQLNPEQYRNLVACSRNISPSDFDVVQANMERNNSFFAMSKALLASIQESDSEKDSRTLEQKFAGILDTVYGQLCALEENKNNYVSTLTNKDFEQLNESFFKGSYLNSVYILKLQLEELQALKAEMTNNPVTYKQSKGLFDYITKRYQRYNQLKTLNQLERHIGQIIYSIQQIQQKYFPESAQLDSMWESVETPKPQRWSMVNFVKSLFATKQSKPEAAPKLSSLDADFASIQKQCQAKAPVTPKESSDEEEDQASQSQKSPWLKANYQLTKTLFTNNDKENGYLADDESEIESAKIVSAELTV